MTRRFTPLLTLVLALSSPAKAQAPASTDWPVYGREPGGTRFSPLTDISRENVSRLAVAWTYRTGETDSAYATRKETSFEATPLMVDGWLYVSTPLGRVIALDPSTGAERWIFNPQIDRTVTYGDFTNRGVSTWLDPNAPVGADCRRRIFIATIDGRLIALDGLTGRPCADFGERGTVRLKIRLRLAPFERAAYEVTSPPVVVPDLGLVITGSAIADNSRIAPASGEVQAFDAKSGVRRWVWDPIPQNPADPAYASWEGGSAHTTGSANVWSVMAMDPKRELVFAPTSSPAPDYFGGLRPGDNRYANSIVALKAGTGQVAWHFQTVHHDIWDYDNASPPVLATVTRAGRQVPVVLQATKTGELFVLHRETGAPVFPVEERRVPPSPVPGEAASATQPFSTGIGPLSPHYFGPDDAWGITPEERAACRAVMIGLRSGGIFTPPSLQGTLVVPSNIGGAHWGGLAYDAEREVAVIPVNRIAAMVQLIMAEGFDGSAISQEDRLAGFEYTHMEGTQYIMRRRILLSPGGLPCTPPPWGALVAVSLKDGKRLWEVPLGSPPQLPGQPPPPPEWGSPNLGGPIVTGGGLVFIGATLDRRFHAFDIDTGKELWSAELPAGAKATPMTYSHGDRQFVVVAAGGGGRFGKGDYVVAYSLPQR